MPVAAIKKMLIIYITRWNFFCFSFLGLCWLHKSRRAKFTQKEKAKRPTCITTSSYSKRRLSPEKKYIAQEKSRCFYPEALYLQNSSSFAFPRGSEKKIRPCWVVKMNALEISFSVWDSGAFLFVSPLELSLPWEPCGPGNKQSFVRADPLCPAARL